MVEDISARLARLEQRVQALEDQIGIYQLMAAYGPAADSGSTEDAVKLWTDDGIYDLHTQVMIGRDDIAEELEGEWHRGLIARGSAHIVSMPYVVIGGDAAVATCHSRLYRRDDDGGYNVISCSANRWEMVRIDGRWHVKRRISRRLDGSDGSHRVLAQGLDPNIG